MNDPAKQRRRWPESLRLVIEVLLIVALAQALLLLALSDIVADLSDAAKVSLGVAALVLMAGPAIYTRVAAARKRWTQAEPDLVSELALVTRHTSNAVILTDAHMCIRWVNEGFSAISGYSMQDALGHSPGELLGNPKADPAALAGLAHAVAAGLPHRVELLNRAKDGQDYWVDINLQPMRDAQGGLCGFMEVDSDITERKRAEHEIELREKRLRQVIDLVPSLIYARDRDGRLLMINQSYADFLQRPAAELIGKTVRELGWSANMAERTRAAEALVRASGLPEVDEEVEFSGPDGKPHLYHTAWVPFAYSQDHPDAVLGVSTDLTELNAARDDVRRSLMLVEATLEALVDGVLVVDRDGAVLDFNQRLVQIWRLPPEITLARDSRRAIKFVLEQLHDPARFMAGFRDILTQPEAESFDLLEFKDGRILERHSRPRIVDGLIMGRVWSYRDVTARERVAAELREREQQLRMVTEHMPALVVRYDANLICRYANAQCAEERGETIDSMMGRHISDFIETRLMPERLPLMQRALAGETVHFERPHRRDANRSFDVTLLPYIRFDGVRDGYFAFAVENTERSRQEETLRRSLARLEGTLESTADGILVMENGDGDRRVARFNQRFVQMWGLPADIAESGDRVRLVDFCQRQMADPSGFAARIAQIVEDAHAESFDLLALQDGRFWERYSRPQVAEGATVGRVWSYRDVTARMHAEAELRAREAQFRLVAESTPALIVHVDRNQICRYANVRYAQALGRELSDVAGHSMVDLLGATYKTLGQDNIRRVLAGEIVRFQREHHQDASRTLDVTLVPYLPPDGTQDGYFGFAFEITEIKQVEAQLRANQQRLRTIIDNEPAAISLADLEHHLLELNAAGLAILEAGSLAEAQARPILEFVVPEHREAFVALGRHAFLEGNAALEFELTGLRGTRRWLETLAVPIRNGEGRITAMLGLTRDISAQKKAQAARDSLESQLRESQKMQAMGTLAGGIAHDFNNIIAAILGNAALARQDIDSGRASRAQESVSEIARAGERAKNLVQQILTFSRRQPVELRPTQLSQVVEESARLLRASLPARLGLSVRCDPQAPMVLADALQFQQVLLNLAGNAMQAMPGGPGRIEIELDAVTLDAALAGASPELDALRQRHPGALARLRVSDDGPGMEQAVRERAFEPFFTTKPMGEGTGLGLSVVSGIVLAHEGVITLDSQPGQGAAFSIYLPGAPAQAGAPLVDAPWPRPQIAAAAPASGARATRVLYIDDDEAMVFMVKRLLERAGLRVSAHQDQYRALDELRAEAGAFDLVVSDYNMPGLSGLDVARQVREIRADLPVALVSGFIDEALQAQAQDAGVRELIFKATDVQEFCAVILKLLVKRAS